MNLKSRQRFIEIDGNTREFWERIDCRRSRKQNNPWVTISTIANFLVLSIEVNQIIANYCYIRVSSRIKKVSTEELRFELPSFHSFNEDFFLFRSLSMKRLCAIEEENVNTTSERRRINRGGEKCSHWREAVGIKTVPGQREGNGVAAFWNAAGKSALLGEEGWRSNFDRVTTAI